MVQAEPNLVCVLRMSVHLGWRLPLGVSVFRFQARVVGLSVLLGLILRSRRGRRLLHAVTSIEVGDASGAAAARARVVGTVVTDVARLLTVQTEVLSEQLCEALGGMAATASATATATTSVSRSGAYNHKCTG